MFNGYNITGNWVVSNVTDMSGLMVHTHLIKYFGNWDVSNVTNMKEMFNGASSFPSTS